MSDINKLQYSLNKTLEYCKKENYTGYNKYDALDSKMLNFLSLGNKWIKLVFSQVVMRFPVNLRPLLLVPKTPNPKGYALFALTYLNLFSAYKKKEYLDEAENFLNLLIENRSPHYHKICWGYQYPWQDVGFFAKAHLPNRVVTNFVCTAFLEAYEITKNQKYLDIVEEAIDFLLNAPKVLFEDDRMKCLSYVPDEKMNWIVMDVSALTSATISRFYKYKPSEYHYQQATKLIRFVVDKQTSYGAWFYSHPANAHTKMHDNYHTGYICDSILEYTIYTGNNEFLDSYNKGIEYYKNHLFLKDGTARWMNNSTYPIDVNGSAQGILSFVKAAEVQKEYLNFAIKIAEWTINNMQNKKLGYFYYQKTKFYKKPFTLMHWSNAWMTYGISKLIKKIHE